MVPVCGGNEQTHNDVRDAAPQRVHGVRVAEQAHLSEDHSSPVRVTFLNITELRKLGMYGTESITETRLIKAAEAILIAVYQPAFQDR
jgi:hypothetical protein